ncbi:conserved hypothetical protein [Trichinella spiralis]|uniref:hypothetical protein n=1 Tax=Trichinella spiralis TaxID=6334 RepID=UPI0001EFDEA7|nr:conserved hypothetical protein [Trichinella spiralis]
MYSHRSKRYLKLPEHRRDQQIPEAFRTTMAGEDFLLWQNALSHILVLATGSNIRLMATSRTFEWYFWLYHNGIKNCLSSIPFWRESWCQQSIVYVRIKILRQS